MKIQSDRKMTEISHRNQQQRQQQAQEQIVAFDGHVSLGFSVYVPNIDIYNVEEMDDSDATTGELSTLLSLFLCSRPNIDLVVPSFGGRVGDDGNNDISSSSIHTAGGENTISENDGAKFVSVCPYDSTSVDSNGRYRKLHQMLEHSSTFDYHDGRRQLQDTMETIIWSIPRIDSEIHTLDFPLLNDENGDEDVDDDETPLGTITYTRWNFTYPVYKWGIADDGALPQSLQGDLDRSIYRGTIDAVLPWDDAQASIIGRETSYFLDIGSDDGWPSQYSSGGYNQGIDSTKTNNNFYGTTMGTDNGTLLQLVGLVVVAVNLVVVVALTALARVHRNKEEVRLRAERVSRQQTKEGLFKYRDDIPRDDGKTLHTEDGVNKMLSASNNYAWTNHHGSSHMAMAATGSNQSSSSMNMFQHVTPPFSSKEYGLLQQAKRQHQQLLRQTHDHLHKQSFHQYGVERQMLLLDIGDDNGKNRVEQEQDDDGDDQLDYSIPDVP